jgi:hypothetical protein
MRRNTLASPFIACAIACANVLQESAVSGAQ